MLTKQVFKHQGVTGVRVGGALFGKPTMTVIFYYLDQHLIDTASFHTRPLINQFSQEHRIEKIILTHYHEDHSGNAGYLQNALGIPVLGHANTANRLSKPVALKPYEHFMFGRIEPTRVTPLPGTVDIGRYQLTPIHTPGHSDDHTVYLEQQQGWLFSGDLFLGPKIKMWRKDEHLNSTIDSLKTVMNYPFDTIFCGHNPQFANAKALLAKKLDQLESLVEQAMLLQQQGNSERGIIKLMTQGKERPLTKLITLGDVSYTNLVKAAIAAAKERLGASVP